MVAKAWTTGQTYKWSGSFLHYEEERHFEKDNQTPLWNTAEQPYSYRIHRSYPTIIVNYFYNRFDHGVRAVATGRAVNKDPLWGFPARTIRIYRWDVKHMQKQAWVANPGTPPPDFVLDDDPFVWMEFELEVNEDTFDIVRPEFGSQRLKDAQGTTPNSRYEHFTIDGWNSGGVVPTTPLKLDAAGDFEAGISTGPHVTTTETFVEFDFTTIQEGGASDMKFPTALPGPGKPGT